MKHKQLLLTTASLLLAASILCGSFNFAGNWEGLYLLKGSPGKLFELKDDILLGEYERLLARIEFQALHERWRSRDAMGGRSYLKYRWSADPGNGYFINFFPDNSKFLACFGRFDADEDMVGKGLFVGGGLPGSHYETAAVKTKETGVAFFDGRGWQRLWGNAQEAISPTADGREQIFPVQWQFLGSKVLFASQYRLALKSSHLARVGQIPVRIDRYLIYHAGERFFTLVNRLTNTGSMPLSYNYCYGDAAAIGKPGTAPGKTVLNQNSSAGSCDCSNPASGEEPGGFTGPTNFIAWQGEMVPTTACFCKQPGGLPSAAARLPADKANMVLLQWDDRKLLPGRSEKMILTIGMASNDPHSGLPLKPAVRLDPEELRYLLSR